MDDKGKTVALLSYLTIIGWIVAIILHQDEKNKSELGAFHLRQALGIILTGIAIGIAGWILLWIPFIGAIVYYVALIGLIVLWVMGLISAVQAEEKPVPLLGEIYQKVLSSLK